MPRCYDLTVGRVITAAAGVICLPALLRAGRRLRGMMYQIMVQRCDRSRLSLATVCTPPYLSSPFRTVRCGSNLPVAPHMRMFHCIGPQDRNVNILQLLEGFRLQRHICQLYRQRLPFVICNTDLLL